MAVHPPICEFGWKAPGFELPGTDGQIHTLEGLMGPNGLLIMFICNHCPYVRSITERLVQDIAELRGHGIAVAAICSNDAEKYHQDSFENMKLFAAERGFDFAYLHDASQAVARRYDAVCTPDFFGFNNRFELQYRGRLDAGGRNQPPPGTRRDLRDAMLAISETGTGPTSQIPSMGCSIKWKL